jgi:cobyrinic acid a,c-diamide synthase
VFFSPVEDERLPPGLDGLYFGGGYPELAAERLAENVSMRNDIREKSAAGMPIYAECGGFMYLCSELISAGGQRFPMAGCFPFATRMLSRLKALGYREIRLPRDTIIGRRGLVLRGHEFHYSELIRPSSRSRSAYQAAGRGASNRKVEGYLAFRTLGSYIHLHFGSAPEAAACLVESCRSYREERNQTA